MRALLDFLSKYHHWFLLLLLEGLSLVLLFQFNHYHQSVWVTTANGVVGRIYEWESSFLNYVTLGKVNSELMRRNLILEYNNEQLTRQLEILRHDSTLAERLQAERLTGVKFMPARVITNSVLRRNNFLTINKGAADGVKPEMGVTCGTGIVGIVYMTSAHYSIVQPLLNSQSCISCRLRGSKYFGYLRWDGGNPQYAALYDIPRHARSSFKVGDEVETSGFSSVFPAGIFVGRISAIEDSEDGLSYKLKIHLGTDFARLQDVCVIQQQFYDELHELEQRADSVANES